MKSRERIYYDNLCSMNKEIMEMALRLSKKGIESSKVLDYAIYSIFMHHMIDDFLSTQKKVISDKKSAENLNILQQLLAVTAISIEQTVPKV